MKIYFDNTLINSDYCSRLIKTSNIFNNNNFKMGNTICETYKMAVDKSVGSIPNIVQLKDENNNLLKTLYVANCDDDDSFIYLLELEDAMTKFNFKYDASQIFVDGKTTLGDIFADICIKAGVNTDISTFYQSTMEVSWYDNTYMARDYLSYIAEINCKNLRISNSNKLEFVDINTTPIKTIDFDDISDYKIGIQHTITKVVLGDWQFGNNNGETYYINEDNVYAITEEIVENIYNEINGFTYYNFKTYNCPINDINSGDLIAFTDGTNTYNTFTQFNEANYSGGYWFGGIDVELNGEVKQETQIIGEAEKYRRIKRTLDYDNLRIDQVVEDVNDQNSKISQMTQTVDTINQKISDIADVTVSGESDIAVVPLENVNASEPITIKIHPIGNNISYIYPSSGLYPSGTLYPKIRTLRFIRTYVEEGQTLTQNIDYELPDDLLYYDNDTYDEFYLSYDSQTCQIIKRCGYNADGTVYALAEEQVITITPYPTIALGDGDYEIKILGYNAGYLYVQLMASNIYTTQFATRVEMNSAINQTAEGINLEVSRKVGKDEVISRINQSAEQISINANKISLAGKTIEMTSDNIAINSTNFKVDKDGNITANSGTFGGSINTAQDCIVGNNLYVGQNQSSDSYDHKTIYFSDEIEISRHRQQNVERLWLYSPVIDLTISDSGTTYDAFYSWLYYTGISNGNQYITLDNGTIIMSSQPVIGSDERLKQEIKDIDISWIDELKVKEFEYIKSPDKKQIGLIAQDYEGKDYAKYFLNQDEDGYYAIGYGNITNALIQYCQEMKKEINYLKEEIKQLKESDK